MAKPKSNTLDRLLANASPEPMSGCWLWLGRTDKGGYARLAVPCADDVWRARLAHRIAYELLRGPIPAGLDVDHLCRVHCCVNPQHLEPVTRRVNIQRGAAVLKDKFGAAGRAVANANKRMRTHCRNGHEWNAENTYVYTRTNGKSHRQCRMCQHLRVTEPEYRAKRRIHN